MTASVTKTSIIVSWEDIECTQQNDVITSYLTEFFHTEGGPYRISGVVNGRSFVAGGLTPNTSYTFQVAGVNAIGSGPFAEEIFRTKEEGIANRKLTSNL